MSTTLFQRNLRHNQLIALYSYWDAARKTAPVPLQTDLTALGLTNWRENLAIIRVREKKKFSYGFYGVGFKDAFGVDMTGLEVATLPHEQTAILNNEYRSVVNTRKPHWRVYAAWFGEEFQTWERLTLPLGDKGGGISYILVGAYRLT
jgi:hypothetical protein